MARSPQVLRSIFRRFRTDPAFSLGTLLTLVVAFGIGTASFSVAYGVLVKPLPYPEPGKLFLLWETKPVEGWAQAPACPASFLAWHAAREVFRDVTAYSVLPLDATLIGHGPPRIVRSLPVYGNFFAVLGVAPSLGAGFSEADSWAGSEPAVVFSHRLWRRLGADPDIVGKVVHLEDVGHRVAGVMPEGFGFPFADLDAWVPIVWHESSRDSRIFRIAHNLRPVARLESGVSPDQARTHLATIAAQLEKEHPDTNARKRAGMTPLREWIAGDLRAPLLLLLGAAALVLLIALANAANLQLVHVSARSRELAVRSALGASRRTLLGQLLAEALILSMIGGFAGLCLGAWGARLLLSLSPDVIPRAEEVGLDAAVLGFSLVVAILAGLTLGLVSAVHALRVGRDPLQEGHWKSRSSPAGGSFRKLLMGSEVALAVLLAIGAGLLFVSFKMLRGVDPGFQPRGLLAVAVSLPRSQYPEDSQKSAFFRLLLERVRSIPGVEEAALADGLPLSGLQWIGSFTVEGRPPTEEREFHHRVVSPSYFEALGVPLLRGRSFSSTDDGEAPGVVVVNESAARHYFHGENPVGRRIRFRREGVQETGWLTIAGVVADERQEGLAAPPRPEVFESYLQAPPRSMHLVLRTPVQGASLLPALRAAVWASDENLPVSEPASLDSLVAEATLRERFTTVLMLIFAGSAFSLAALGIFAMTSRSVLERTHEIGVRMALGATRGRVVLWVVAGALYPILLGVAAGVFGAFSLGSFLESLLFEVRSDDPVVFIAVAAALAGLAVLASYLPARKASKLDPLHSLRQE